MHMAIGAVVNAAWDLAAKVAGKPLWRLLADMTPEQLVRLVDFRYLEDALTPAEALDILRAARQGRDERIAELEAVGYPAYTTTPGWIGYSDEKLVALVPAGGRRRVHPDQAEGGRGHRRGRPPDGPGPGGGGTGHPDRGRRQPALGGRPRPRRAIAAIAPWDPYWVEEPTSPDEILGLAVDPRPPSRRSRSPSASTSPTG